MEFERVSCRQISNYVVPTHLMPKRKKSVRQPGVEPRSIAWKTTMLMVTPLTLIGETVHWTHVGFVIFYVWLTKIQCKLVGKIWEKKCASPGSRTRIDCLEGNHANRYTSDASCQRHLNYEFDTI